MAPTARCSRAHQSPLTPPSNLDVAANNWVERDGAVLKRADNAVGVFAFEGGHQVPPPLHQQIAFEWLLGRETDPRGGP